MVIFVQWSIVVERCFAAVDASGFNEYFAAVCVAATQLLATALPQLQSQPCAVLIATQRDSLLALNNPVAEDQEEDVAARPTPGEAYRMMWEDEPSSELTENVPHVARLLQVCAADAATIWQFRGR
jgi:hypothetical protein